VAASPNSAQGVTTTLVVVIRAKTVLRLRAGGNIMSMLVMVFGSKAAVGHRNGELRGLGGDPVRCIREAQLIDVIPYNDIATVVRTVLTASILHEVGMHITAVRL
jgi:hypothetical protein